MKKSQRKLHFRIWLFLAFLIPPAYLSSILVIPKTAVQQSVFLPQIEKYSTVISRKAKDNLIAVVRSNDTSDQYQIELIVTTPFKNPDMGVYYTTSNNFQFDESSFLGNLSTKSGKLFQLPVASEKNDHFQIVVFDPIRKELLTQISFEL